MSQIKEIFRGFREFFRRFKFVRMRTPNLTKVMLTVVIVLSMVVLITLGISLKDLAARTEDLRNQAAALEYENQVLDEKIEDLGSVKSIVEIAEEELDLVQPGGVDFQPES